MSYGGGSASTSASKPAARAARAASGSGSSNTTASSIPSPGSWGATTPRGGAGRGATSGTPRAQKTSSAARRDWSSRPNRRSCSACAKDGAPRVNRREELLELERRVEVAHGELLYAAPHFAVRARWGAAPTGSPTLITLTSSTAGSGSGSRTTSLVFVPGGRTRRSRAADHRRGPRLRDGLHDPGVRRAVSTTTFTGSSNRCSMAASIVVTRGGVVPAASLEHVAARDVGRYVREPELLEAGLCR